MCAHMCQHIMSKGLCVQYVCAWLVLAAWVMRGVRPECMAWFSQRADESWQLQDCLLQLVGPYRFRLLLPITFMVTARLSVYIYIHRAVGKTFHLCKGEYGVASVCLPILLYCPLILTPQPAFGYSQTLRPGSVFLSHTHGHKHTMASVHGIYATHTIWAMFNTKT